MSGGYEVSLVNPQDALAKHFCLCCKRLLCEPVQIVDDEFAGDLYCCACIPDRNLEYRLDRAVKREILKFQVYCNCQWQGTLKQYLQHHENCQSVLSRCDVEEENRRVRRENHKLKYEIAKLKQQPAPERPSTQVLLFSNLAEGCPDIEPGLDIPLAEDNGSKIHDVQPMLVAPLGDTFAQNDALPLTSSDFNKKIAHYQASASSLLERSKQNEGISSHFEQDMQQHASDLTRFSRASALRQFGINQGQKMKLYDAAAKNFTIFTERPPNGSAMQCRWRIPNVTKNLAYAREHPNEPLTSPPWTSGPGGCSVRAHLYLNGKDGGFDNYVSTFISVLPGHDDDFIPWPIDAVFTFVLLDYEKNTRPILKTLRYTFQRPPSPTDISNEVGCPCFAPITTLSNEKYVKDDAMSWEFCFRSNKV